MTINQLIRKYDNFNYNSEFIPDYNIFNVNSNNYIGIGTNIPNHHLTVTHNINIKGNLIINGNFILNQNTSNVYDNSFIHILYKNNTQDLKIGKLIYSSPDSKYSDYNFYQKNNSLYVNTNDERPNTILTYKSSIYEHDDTNTSLNIELLVSHKIYITHIYIYNTSGILNTLNELKINNISTTFNNNIYILSEPIELTPHIKNTLSIINATDVNKFIQFIGNYDFSAGTLWNNNNTTVYTDKNVNILSNGNNSNNSNNSNKLYVNGDGLINRNYNSDTINTNIFTNTANLDLDGILVTKNIVSNKLIIDTPQISFGNNNSNHLTTIGDNTFISSSGNLHIQDLTVNNNINLNNLNSSYNETLTLSNNININNFVNINNINTHFYHNTVISNKSNYDSYNFTNNTLLVDGNTLINGNLKYDNITYDNYKLDGDYINANINSIYISGLAHTGAFTKTNHITTNTLVSPNINLQPTIQKTNKPGTIFYDNSEDIFKVHTSNNVIQFNLSTTQEQDNSNFILSQNNSILEIKNLNTNFLNITNLHTTHLDTNNTHTQTISLPLYDNIPDDYIFNDLIGQMTFHSNSNSNSNSKYLQVNDGEKWNMLQFESDFNIPLTNTKHPVYSILPNINLIKNSEQFIPTIPQNFKYNITLSNGSYYNSDTNDNNRITINHRNEKKIYNLNRDDTFGIAINNNIIGIGTNLYITSNINIVNSQANNSQANNSQTNNSQADNSQINTDTNLYQATFINENDYEDPNSVFVNITIPGSLDDSISNNSFVGAYALQKLFRSYDGPNIRIKSDIINNGISTGSAIEADLYFDMNGLLYHIDTILSTESTNLVNWLNNENAHVIKWYDQSANNNDLIIDTYGPILKKLDSSLSNKYGIYFDDDNDRKLYNNHFKNFNNTNDQSHTIITEYNFTGDNNDNLFALYNTDYQTNNSNNTNTNNKVIGFQPLVSSGLNNYYFYNDETTSITTNNIDNNTSTHLNNSILALQYNSADSDKIIFKNAHIINTVNNSVDLNIDNNITLELGNNSIRSENTYKFKGTIYSFLISNKLILQDTIMKISSNLNKRLPGIFDGHSLPSDYYGAYALIKLFSSYNGPTVRIKRTNDNYGTDIYFDKDGNVYYIENEYTIDLITWLNGQNATITTWYDQSNNNKHLTETDENKRPILKLNSNSNIFGNKIGVYFNGTQNKKLSVSNFNNTSINETAIVIGFKTETLDNNEYYLFDINNTSNINNTNSRITNNSSNGTKWNVNGTDHTASNITDGNLFLISSFDPWFIIANNTQQIYTNDSSDSLSVSVNQTLVVGNSISTNNTFYGTMYHLLIRKTWKTSWNLDNLYFDETINMLNIHLDYYNKLSVNQYGLNRNLSGLLDGVANNKTFISAYALVKLFSFYNGPIIRVQRNSDNYETDIYFDKNGNTYLIENEYTTDLETWLNGQTAKIIKWYDQSSSENHLISTNGKEPQLKLNDDITILGKYKVLFSGANNNEDYLFNNNLSNFSTVNNQDHTILSGYEFSTSGNSSNLFSIHNNTSNGSDVIRFDPSGSGMYYFTDILTNDDSLDCNLDSNFNISTITLSYNSENYKLKSYINGLQSSSTDALYFLTLQLSNNNKLQLGGINVPNPPTSGFDGSIYNFLVTNTTLDDDIIININNKLLNKTIPEYNYQKNSQSSSTDVYRLNTYLNNQINKNFSIYKNNLYIDNFYNNTLIKLKQKQQIGIRSFSGYLYYEPLLDYIELLNHTTNNKLTNIDVRIYIYNIYNSNIGSNRVKFIYTLMPSYIEFYVNNSSYFRGDSISIPSNKIVTLEIIDKRNFIYNIYTFIINS